MNEIAAIKQLRDNAEQITKSLNMVIESVEKLVEFVEIIYKRLDKLEAKTDVEDE